MNVSKLFHIFILFFSTLFFFPINTGHHSAKMIVHMGNHQNSRSIKESQFHNYSHHDTGNKSRIGSSYSHQSHFKQYTAQDFRNYFTHGGYTEKEILSQRCLYMFDEFVKFAQTYSSYTCTIQQLHAELKNLGFWQKIYYVVKGTYCPGLQKRIHYLYDQLSTLKKETITHKQPTIYEHSLATFPQHHTEYKALNDIYHEHTPSLSHAIDTRVNAFNDMTKGDYALHYASKSYNLNNNVKQLLNKYGHDTTRFAQCYGHQLHQTLHQESLDLLDRIDNLPSNSLLYDHQEALVDFTVSMVDYNHENLTDKAMSVADLCWTLLDCGQAIAQGTALGVYSAATDILNNPIEATLSIVASKPLLAYQLSKVLYNVADIGITAITNFDGAKDKWSKYTEPLHNIIDAINKKEISMHDAIKGGTAFIVGLTAQGKLLGGLGKFCNTIKQKSITFTKNSSLLNPQEYLTTPDGLLFKATAQSNKLKQTGQTTASNLKTNVDNKISKNKNIIPTQKTGSLIIEQGGKFSESEKRAAQYMSNLGNNVTLRVPKGTRADGCTSDLLVNGINYDVYTPITKNPSRIISAIAAKKDQATGIILDLSQTSVTIEQLGNIKARLLGKGVTNITDIIVLK